MSPSKQKPKPKTSSFKTSSTTRSSKKKVSEQKPGYYKTKETVPSMNNDENNIELDFPALGASIDHTSPSTVWNKPFGVSFSEKLKSNNTSSYFYKEPPRLSSDRPKEESAMKSKENKDKIMNKQTRMVHNERLSKKSADNITKPNIVNQTSEKDITKSQSDDEGFFIVRNKARRLCETVEWNDSKSLG